MEKLAEFQNSYQASLDQNGQKSQPQKRKRSRKDREKEKEKKKGVVFQLKNNQIFKFHKKHQPKVTYADANRKAPRKGALKLKSAFGRKR